MKILLGSSSPRRQQLLKQMEIQFTLAPIICEERFEDLTAEEVAPYLAQLKSLAYQGLNDNELLITADTTVIFDGTILNKPKNNRDAYDMLSTLSGLGHEVMTAVCLRTNDTMISFEEVSTVFMDEISSDEIRHYVDTYIPLDKAGSYGIQEWLGLCKIKRIEGCFYNIMGLPCSRLYRELRSEFNIP